MIKKYLKTLLPHALFLYQFLGNRLILLYVLSFLVGTLDAFGIAFIIPLLKIADSPTGGASSHDSSGGGNLLFVDQIVNFLGIELNLINILILIIAVFVLKGGIKFYQGYYKFRLRAIFTKKIRLNLIKGFLNYDYKEYINTNSGKYTNALINETVQVSGSFNFYNSAVISLFTVVCYFYFAFLANPIFSVAAILVGGIISLFMRGLTKNTKAQSMELADNNAEFSNILIQTIQNFKYIKTTGTYKKFQNKLVKNINFLELKMTKIGFNTSLSTSVREPLTIGFILLIVIIQNKVLGASISSILVALFLFYRALGEIVQYQSNWQNFNAQYGSVKSIQDMIIELNSHAEHNTNNQPVEFNKDIKLEDISFSFTEGRKIINKVNLEIKKNTTVAFVGESGSGKTTIIDIITGILRAQEGRVLIDGKNLDDSDKANWRSKIGFISQEQIVFNDTVLNNISLWDDELSTKEVQDKVDKAAIQAHSKTFIEKMGEGYKSQIGDRGVKLSGGQRQRLSIARELYKNIEVLILDEATSALDSESESIIKANIDEMKGELTIIIIAHRLSTIKNADVIYVLNQGKIEEFGSFDDLTANENSKFSRMVKLQLL